MKLQTQRAKEIDAFVESHQDSTIGRWPVEIAGEKEILAFYRFPLHLLHYNINNGRLAMEKQEWEEHNNRVLEADEPDDALLIRSMLLKLDTEKTSVLKDDLHKKGQMEPGVISYDGFVINGNRRMAIMEELHDEEPTGKWRFLEAVRLPADISEQDLWKIEAGLQLSKDKVAEYHPVNELIKIKQGINAGLSPEEVAAAMYGRTVSEVKQALERLELINDFLAFFNPKKPRNYGLIKRFGLHEYFIDIQKSVVAAAKRKGLPKRNILDRIKYSFALIRSGVLIQGRSMESGRRVKGITHWDIRKLDKVFSDAHASGAYLEHLKKTKKLIEVDPEIVIEDFRGAVEILEMRDERDRPAKLVEKAIKALQSIDRDSEHFNDDSVKEAFASLVDLVQEIEGELAS